MWDAREALIPGGAYDRSSQFNGWSTPTANLPDQSYSSNPKRFVFLLLERCRLLAEEAVNVALKLMRDKQIYLLPYINLHQNFIT